MRATALVTAADETVSVEPVEFPEPTDGDIVVDTSYSGVSVGTELNLIRGNVDWGPFPICTGYQAVGEVIEVGSDVSGFDEGETVYYRDNVGRAGSERSVRAVESGRTVSAAAGTHASRALIDPDRSHGVARLPAGVEPRVGSLFVMPAVGLNGVDMAGVGYADTVVVQGTGLVGLGVVAAASQRGAKVVAIDPVEERLTVAAELGADHLIDPSGAEVFPAVEEIAPEGADVVFEATGNADLVDTALELCKRHGTFVFQGDYGAVDVSFYFRTPHHNRITAHFPCDDGQEPCRRAIMKNLANGVLPWGETITHEIDAADAPEFYRELNEKRPGEAIGATIDWRGVD
jgi:2-desacetyl-2-hydroxyethyl bacteriochlorophyllide A dehydrogenase